MPSLHKTHDGIRTDLYHLSSLQSAEREAVAEAIIRLSDGDDWYPESLRRRLKELQSQRVISETDRHAVEKHFFPDHQW